LSQIHKHTLIDFKCRNPISEPDILNQWLTELVRLVDMEIFQPASSKYCNDPDNSGITGTILLTTSHASIHIWDLVDKPFGKFDLYSCKEYDPQIVIDHLKLFEPYEVNYIVVDRTKSQFEITSRVS